MKTKKVTIGIIGAGMIAKDHIAHLQKSKRCTVFGIAAATELSVSLVQKEFNIPFGTTNYKELLAKPEIDAVIIAAPPYLHKKMFLDAVKAQKHILIEKPFAISKQDAIAMLAAQKNHPDLIILDASCRHSRLQPKFFYVKKIIDSGRLGDIYHIHHTALSQHMRPGIEYHPSAKWFLDKKLAGGGIMLDWGVYDLSFHLGLLGDKHTLKSMQSFTKNGLDNTDPNAPIFDVEEHGSAFMHFDKGLTYYWERSSHANVQSNNETRIFGTKAGIKLSYCTWDSPEISFFDVANNGTGKARTTQLKAPLKGHTNDNKALNEHFLDCLTGKDKPLIPLSLAKKHLDIILKILK